jgi:hypothetical protein
MDRNGDGGGSDGGRGRDSGRGVIESVIQKDISECALINHDPSNTCVSDDAKRELAKIAGVSATLSTDVVVNRAKEKTGCKSLRCTLKHAGDAGKKDIIYKLKLDGPTDVSLLNNFHIDDTMKQWTQRFTDFFPYDFNMRDFEANGKTLHTITMDQLYNGSTDTQITRRILTGDDATSHKPRKFRTAGCVINTDLYTGRGVHWMALFVDMRATSGIWTVEFFNSSGNAPSIEYAGWLEKTKIQLESIIATHGLKITVLIKRVCLTHQRSRTECGVYSLFYIYSRLLGVPVEFFQKNRVPDEVMFEFRQHLFHDNSSRSLMKVWDISAWLGSGVQPKWETLQ